MKEPEDMKEPEAAHRMSSTLQLTYPPYSLFQN